MVEVKNLDTALARINPPMSNSKLRHIVSSFESLADYVSSNGVLPPGFRSIRDEPRELFTGATHVSPRDWGWLGKHDLTAAIRFEEGSPESPIAVIAVVHSKSPKTPDFKIQRREVYRFKSQRSGREKHALENGQVPKFRH